MALINEIQLKSKEIIVDSYSMSVGELISLYKDGDLDIHPEFQRFFRWTDSQKTRLIESLLLNIPIPPIFVSQNENGVWEIVDGLQRVSTILHFVGCYKNNDGNLEAPLVLEGTDFLPSLEGKTFEKRNDDDENAFGIEERRYLKRAKISLIILKKESDISGKYELFQRLNTGGTSLSDQEVRNCIMLMENKDLFYKIQELSNYQNFLDTLRVNHRLMKERFELELITRFLCLRTENPEQVRNKDFSDYLDKRIVNLFNSPEWNVDNEIEIFKRTFDIINREMSDNAFCKYMQDDDRFKGSLITPAFEIIAIGLGRRDGHLPDGFNLLEQTKKFWRELPQTVPWKGKSATDRVPQMFELASSFYGQD